MAFIFKLAYGRTITGLDDDFVRLAEKGVSDALSGVGSGPGSSLVDFFPICKHPAVLSLDNLLSSIHQCATFLHGSPGLVSKKSPQMLEWVSER